ncbi:MAG: Smr/MutS family protein [Rectinemataceae bacterium]
MDFGDILDDWEALKKREARAAKNAAKSVSKKPLKPSAKADASAPASIGKSAPASTGARPSAITAAQTATVAAATAEAAAKKALSRWLDLHGVEDKDSADRNPDGKNSGPQDRSGRIAESDRIRRMTPQDSIDLHGMNGRDAETALRAFLVSAVSRGFDKILIIHGKGNHSPGDQVLGGVVRRVLESSDLAGSFGYAGRDQGGRGATWVAIRKPGYFSR